MKYYRKISHSICDIKYHFFWITKYRKPVLFRNVAARLHDLLQEICKSVDVEILKGHVSKDQLSVGIFSCGAFHVVDGIGQNLDDTSSIEDFIIPLKLPQAAEALLAADKIHYM